MKAGRGKPNRFKAHFRVYCGDDVALGPGKVELLRHIAGTGSIADAARRMEMSYNRAWLLVRTMNRSFKQPLVVAMRGGETRGGAQLTENGRRMIALYAELDKKSLQAARPLLRKILPRLKNGRKLGIPPR